MGEAGAELLGRLVEVPGEGVTASGLMRREAAARDKTAGRRGIEGLVGGARGGLLGLLAQPSCDPCWHDAAERDAGKVREDVAGGQGTDEVAGGPARVAQECGDARAAGGDVGGETGRAEGESLARTAEHEQRDASAEHLRLLP